MTAVRRLIALVTAALTVVVLAACAAIPVSGPVEHARPIEEDRAQGWRYYPAAPFPGASREEIVQGFLDAGTGAQNDFATAREYLDPAIAGTWRPTGQVYVTDGQASMKTESDEVITVQVQVHGRLDARGNLVDSVTATTETIRFELREVDGEWRISSAPDGIVLQKQAFNDLFKARTLHFFGSQLRYLSPDLRWFLNLGDVPTRVVRELLNGPAEWLAVGGAVRSAFPSGVQLRHPVVIESGLAIVDLTDTASTASPDELKLMRLQLEETLTALGDIQAVEVRVNGARLDIALPASDAVVRAPDVNSSPMVAQQDRIGYLTGGQLTLPIGGERVAAAAEQLRPIRGAISASRRTVALLAEDGTWAMRFDGQPVLVDARSGQIEPALDNWDWVWTQSTTDPGLLVSRVGETGLDAVPLPDGVADDFISHQVSRDGTRLAVLYRMGDRIKLAVMAVIRDDTKPVALGPPLILDMPGRSPLDVAWVDANTVAMLVDMPDGATDVRVYRIGGDQVNSLGQIQYAMQVAGSTSIAGMRVVDRNGTLYAPRGSGWRSSDSVVTFLFAQV